MNHSTSGLPVHHRMNSRNPPKPISIKSMMPSSHLILCHSLLLVLPIPPSIRDFSNESTPCMRWPKYWSFSFSISPSYDYSGLIAFRMDWLDLLAVQETLKSLLQHHSSEASILQRSAFFTVQLSHLYMTTGKTIALPRRTFIGKVMYLLFSMLSRLVITFLPRSKRLLISWLQSPSAVILDHFQFALIHAPNIPGSNAILLFTASDLDSITSHIHNWVLFLLGLHPFILSGVISPLISSSILGTYWPGEFLFQYPIILPFSTVHGVLKARILKWFAIPFSSGPHTVRSPRIYI